MLLRLYENDMVRVHSDKQKKKTTITDDRILIIVITLQDKRLGDYPLNKGIVLLKQSAYDTL